MEQHANLDPPQWPNWQRGVPIQNVQRQEGQSVAGREVGLTPSQIGSLLVIAAVLVYIFLSFYLDTAKAKRMPHMPVKTKPPTNAEEFLDSVEALPDVDKYISFHEDIRKKNKAKTVELSITNGNRITLYLFADESCLEISETWENGKPKDITFKAI